jgi:acylphosphatase
MIVGKRLVVSGRVQGVGFRYFVLQAAEPLGITGFVRNLRDGTVEIVAEGSPIDVRALAMDVLAGPRHGRVDEIDKTDIPVTGQYAGFEIRY